MQAQSNVQPKQSLEHFPINIFAAVMGFAGLSLAWLHSVQTGLAWGECVGGILRAFTSALFLVLLIVYVVKVIRYPAAVGEEMRHPIKISFFATIPISITLLAQLWLPADVGTARTLWLIASILMLIATMATFYSWMYHTHYKRPHLNPAWFIPVVGTILVPIAGVPLGYIGISWFFFSIGIVFWMVLLVLITGRLFFEPPIPERMLPTLFILLAPPAVGFIALVFLENQTLSTLSQVLYGVTLFLTLVLATSARRFWRLPFMLSSWAFGFPTAAVTLATIRMYGLNGESSLAVFALLLLAFLSLLILWLTVSTLIAIVRGRFFLPEPPL